MRRRVAILTLVVFAALVPATPATAVNEYLCTGVPPSDFADVPVFSPFKPFIDCLVFFGITTGTGPNAFSPSAPVERWQMAIFLQRVWAEGLLLNPLSGTFQGFTDIGSLSDEAQLAINQTSQISVTSGVAPGLYGPFDPVTRWQMAIFLARFARVAGTALPPPSPTGFTDTSSLSVEAQDSISIVKSLGITTGTSATTYSPHDVVTREQMAAFLIRTLQATWFLAVGGFTTNCVTDSQGVELCTGSGTWVPGVPLRFLHGLRLELPADTSGFDHPTTRVELYVDGVLQAAKEISIVLPAVKFRLWEALVPGGLTGSHVLEARFYGEGTLFSVETATVVFD